MGRGWRVVGQYHIRIGESGRRGRHRDSRVLANLHLQRLWRIDLFSEELFALFMHANKRKQALQTFSYAAGR